MTTGTGTTGGSGTAATGGVSGQGAQGSMTDYVYQQTSTTPNVESGGQGSSTSGNVSGQQQGNSAAGIAAEVAAGGASIGGSCTSAERTVKENSKNQIKSSRINIRCSHRYYLSLQYSGILNGECATKEVQ